MVLDFNNILTMEIIKIPKESQRIYREYFRFAEYCKQHKGYTPLLRNFIKYLEDKGIVTITKKGLYKIKDGVTIVYKN